LGVALELVPPLPLGGGVTTLELGVGSTGFSSFVVSLARGVG
jgi:hypothetical protein